MILHRIRTWALLGWLTVACIIRGHDYGRHFSELFRRDMDERPWCSRCGRDAEGGGR